MYSFWFKSFNYVAPAEFITHFCSIRLLQKTGNQVILELEHRYDTRFSHFIVTKSFNGKDYTDAGVLFTDGNSSTPIRITHLRRT